MHPSPSRLCGNGSAAFVVQAVRLTSRMRHAHRVEATYVDPFDRICHGIRVRKPRNYRPGRSSRVILSEELCRNFGLKQRTHFYRLKHTETSQASAHRQHSVKPNARCPKARCKSDARLPQDHCSGIHATLDMLEGGPKGCHQRDSDGWNGNRMQRPSLHGPPSPPSLQASQQTKRPSPHRRFLPSGLYAGQQRTR